MAAGPRIASAWERVDHAPAFPLACLRAGNAERDGDYSVDVAGIHFDFSTLRHTEAALDAFPGLADAAGFLPSAGRSSPVSWSMRPRGDRRSTKPNVDGARLCPGDRPCTAIFLERLDARTLGALLAFYELRTFSRAAHFDNNPSD